MISASVKWSKEIEEFLNLLFVKWQYIFGSHLEAARYMEIGFYVVHVENNKLEKILGTVCYYYIYNSMLFDFCIYFFLDYLKNNIKCCRCVLVTSNPNEPNIISSYIQQGVSDIEVLLPGQLKSGKGK